MLSDSRSGSISYFSMTSSVVTIIQTSIPSSLRMGLLLAVTRPTVDKNSRSFLVRYTSAGGVLVINDNCGYNIKTSVRDCAETLHILALSAGFTRREHDHELINWASVSQLSHRSDSQPVEHRIHKTLRGYQKTRYRDGERTTLSASARTQKASVDTPTPFWPVSHERPLVDRQDPPNSTSPPRALLLSTYRSFGGEISSTPGD
jgi:hypothetical protein